MAEHSTVFTGPETQEALVTDRVRTWNAFTGATTGAVIVAVIILALMGFFL
ncbi:MAG: hypothetical protein J0H19_13315 [Rhodospirillales bacterium]|nr:hypothetical protein [Rhodospirillales bacterium]MBN8927591.1 hypothetical protein [Rhodospirillales bacterium]